MKPGNFFAPQPLIRLEFLRIFLPLAILAFLSHRILHAGEWLTDAGFQVPDLGRKDWRQPLYLSPLPIWAAWGLCGLAVASGLMVSIGFRTRLAAAVFAFCLAYVALADRLASFTVNKLGTILIFALVLVPCGRMFSLDARLDSGRSGRMAGEEAPWVTWGNVRFFQALLCTLYLASGISKWRGDWVSHPHVLWTHMHDSYQAAFAFHFANAIPVEAWRPMQYAVLGFEILAPLWFVLPWTRLPALGFGLLMHLVIGLCFGPVKWFALLMGILLLGAFAPTSWLESLFRPLQSLRPPRPIRPIGPGHAKNR